MTEFFINKGVVEPLAAIIKNHGAGQRIAIVRGGKSFPKALIMASIAEVDCVAIEHVSGFSPNPKFDEIEKGLAQIVAFKPDLVIGVGGGSILDIAKILSCLARFDGTREELATILQGGNYELPTKRPKLVLLPTTAGSGAEVTGFSVVYFGLDKYSFLHSGLIPDYAITDITLVKDAPRAVLASSAMDALAQSIESYWAKGGTNESRDYARDAMVLMWHSIGAAINDRDPQALADIVKGSNLAGRAINISKTTGNHALSYRITSDHKVPHGHCVGMLLPKFFALHDAIGHADPERASGVLMAQQEIAAHLGYGSFDDFRIAYDEKLQSIALASFDDLDREYKFDGHAIAASVNVQRLGNHPVVLNMAELESIFV